MYRLVVTLEFERRFRDLPADIKRKVIKQEKYLREHPLHPSLRCEKLEPKDREVWSFRVDRTYRVLFRCLDDRQILLLTVGQHDWIYRLKF